MLNGTFGVEELLKNFTATGNTNAVRQFLSSEERAKLKPGDLAPEQRDEQGRVLREIEVAHNTERFGRSLLETFTVRVPEGAWAKRLVFGAQVRFVGLTLHINPRREGGLNVNMSAEDVQVVSGGAES